VGDAVRSHGQPTPRLQLDGQGCATLKRPAEQLGHDLAQCRDLSGLGAIGWCVAGISTIASQLVIASTTVRALECAGFSALGVIVGAALFGAVPWRQWQRGLEIDQPLPEPAIVRLGVRAVPLAWRIFTVFFTVSGLVQLVIYAVSHPTLSVPLFPMAVGGGMWLGIGLVLASAHHATLALEHDRSGRLLVLFDPLKGFGVDAPNRQLYLWIDRPVP
jgi:hypothetical protein